MNVSENESLLIILNDWCVNNLSYIISTERSWKLNEKLKIFQVKPQKLHSQKEVVAENTLIRIS